MNKEDLLEKLTDIRILAEHNAEDNIVAHEVILALLAYIDNVDIESAVYDIPF